MRNLKKLVFALSFVWFHGSLRRTQRGAPYGWAKMPEGRAWGSTSTLDVDRSGNVMGVRALRRQLLRGIVAAAGSAIRSDRKLCARVRRGPVRVSARY